jgi:hypothetical protein
MWQAALFRAGGRLCEGGGGAVRFTSSGKDIGGSDALDDFPLGCDRRMLTGIDVPCAREPAA